MDASRLFEDPRAAQANARAANNRSSTCRGPWKSEHRHSPIATRRRHPVIVPPALLIADGDRPEARLRIGTHIQMGSVCGPSTSQDILLLDGVSTRAIIITLVLEDEEDDEAVLRSPLFSFVFLAVDGVLKFGSIRARSRSVFSPPAGPRPLGNLGPLELRRLVVGLDALPVVVRESFAAMWWWRPCFCLRACRRLRYSAAELPSMLRRLHTLLAVVPAALGLHHSYR